MVRESSGRILASLIGQFRDFQLAEESLQDAWLVAAETWPRDGWPDNPAGWVRTVAGRKALDTVRRERTRADRHTDAQLELRDRELDEIDRRGERWHSGIDDDRLRLIFTCCHPVLDLDARVALTLRSVAWLTTDEIAHAFGVPTPTMAQRIVRAKQKIQSAGVPYEVPVGHELPDRLAGALRVVYLVFNEAYLASHHDDAIRTDLADEAIRLGRELHELMPDEPEVGGLLALMTTVHARRDARLDAAGDLVLLEHQDRSRWDRSMISEAATLLELAMRRRSLGPYQLQAAIASLHSEAPTFADTDWAQISALYGVLATIEANPVVELNRGVALGYAHGAAAGLAAIDAVDPDRLPGRHLYHAARAEMLVRVTRVDEAIGEFELALEHVTNDAERRHLTRRREQIRLGG